MRYALAPLALSLGTNALVARDAQTCVQLKASGGASGILGQLSDGQNRVGGGHPTGCYCLGSNGGWTDSMGRGCILTPPTTQFQCDQGAKPSTGFAIGSGGSITHNGNSKFYACPVNDNGEYNVYSKPAPGQKKCVEISLSSGGSCGAGSQSSMVNSAPAQSKPAYTPIQPSQPAKPSQPAQPSAPASKPAPAPSQPAMPSTMVSQPSKPAMSMPAYQPSPPPQAPQPKPSAPAPSQPAPKPSAPAPSQPAPQPSSPAQSQPAPKPSTPAGSCPADLNGNYQYPHLIIPVNSQSPNKAYGTSYFGTVNSTTCSIFNFDIPMSYSGKTCTVVFLFPEQKNLETSSFTTSGSGNVQFTKMNSPATQKTCYANQPEKGSQLANVAVMPGNQYVVASGSCAAGQTVSYQMCSSGGYSLNYFQDYNPSPIGLYVRQC